MQQESIGFHVANNSDIGYESFSQVPWFRRSVVNLSAAVVGLVIPPSLWFVCFVLFTGPVYTPKKDEDGTFRTWGSGTKWVVLILALLQVYRWLRDAL